MNDKTKKKDVPVKKERGGKPDVAEQFNLGIKLCGKSLAELAEELGYSNPNFLTMVRHGRSRIPIDRAADFGRAVGLDPATFMMACIEQYQPRMAEALRDVFFTSNHLMVSKGEMKVIKCMRSTMKNANVAPKTRADMDALRSLIKTWERDND